jgi:hypothetical protein
MPVARSDASNLPAPCIGCRIPQRQMAAITAIQTTLVKDNEVVYFLMVGKLDTTDVVNNGA